MITVDVERLSRIRDLLWAWTGRIIRARYQQSVLGGLWVIAQPTATVMIFTIIFTRIVPVDTGDIPYAVFSYVAVVPWMFLVTSLADMADSLVTNMSLVTKIYFQREVLPIAAMLARLLDAVVAASLLVVLMLIFRVPLYLPGLLFLPIILAIQICLVLGLGLFLAAGNVFYRDVRPLLVLGIQLWFYASPIIYPVSMVPERLRPFYFLNPMAGILEAYRSVLLYQTLPGSYLYLAGLMSLLALGGGFYFFKRFEYRFADIV